MKELIIDIDLWRRRLREAKRGLLKYRKVLGRQLAEVDQRRAELDRVLEEPGAPSYTCPRCEMTSYNRNDIEHQYCGNCHMTRDQVERLPKGAEREDHP